MRIKRKSIAMKPIQGGIVDTLNVEDKIKNAPSINLVEQMTGIPTEGIIQFDGTEDEIPEGYEKVKIVTDYTLTGLPETTLVSNYLLKKIGKIVSLNTECIWTESLTQNAWSQVGILPTELKPEKAFSSVATIIDAQSGNITGYGRILVSAEGVVSVKPTVARTSRTGIAFSITWILD